MNTNIKTIKESDYPDSKVQINDFWWKVNADTNQYVCSDMLSGLLGVVDESLNHDDFILLIHPSQKNRVIDSLSFALQKGDFDEKFQILTRYGYRWAHSLIDEYVMDEEGHRICCGHLCFLECNDVAEAQDDDNQIRLDEIIGRYNSISDSLMELLHHKDKAEVILQTLDGLLDEFKGDRAYIFEYDFEKFTQSCAYEVVRDMVKSEQKDLQNIPLSDTAWWTEMLINRGEPIICNNIDELIPNAEEEYNMLKVQNIQSLMVVPLITKDGVGGYMGIDMVGKRRNWTNIDRQWFLSLANVISLCVELKISEEEARYEREHYQKLYENMPIGFVRFKLMYDNEGRVVDYKYMEMNSLASKYMIGIDKMTIGKLASSVSPDDYEINLTEFEELIRSQGMVKSGKINSVKNRKFFDYKMYSIENDEIIILIQDNTESTLASKALKKSEKTLQNIYRNIPVGIEIYDRDGILVSVNEKEKEIFGFNDENEVLGLNLFENPIVPPAFLNDLKYGKPSWCDFYYEFENLKNYYDTQNTSKRHIVLRGALLYDADHNVENYMLIVLDNTDSLQANHKIKEFELLFNSIAQFSEVGLCQWNPCDKTIFGTDQWYYNLCQERRPITDIFEAYANFYEEDLARIKFGFEGIISGEITSFREEVRVKDGANWKWLRANYKVSDYRPQDNKIEIIGINIDITELKNTELKLTEAKLKAEESDRLKSAFLANMSHEIRTPLNAIVGFSDLLVDTLDVEERQEYISIIRRNNELLLQLISDILDISKIESGMVELTSECMDVNELCREIVCAQTVKVHDGVELIFETKPEERMVIADKNRFMQVLGNLIGNAIKFTNQGSIRIGYVEQGNLLKFYVKDSGVGIPKRQINAIFDRFIKLNNFISGTGLGLSICRNIVEKMGGEIWVESEVGVGSCFWFTIPCDTDDVMLKQLESKCNDSNSTKKDAPAKLKTVDKPLILVAEDTDSNYLLVSAILAHEYRIIRAKDGVEAIKLFEEHNPNLVLMDMKMPNMGGLEATRIILKSNQTVPVIMLTAFAYDNDKMLAKEAGCCDFMTKPLHAAKLKELVDKYIK